MDKLTFSFASFRFSVRFAVVTALALVCCIVAIITLSLQYYYSTSQLEKHALKEFEQFVGQSKKALQNNDVQAKLLVDLLSIYPDIEAQSPRTKLNLISEMMASNPLVFGLYMATPEGNFFEVVNLNTTGARKQYFAEDNDIWLTLAINVDQDPNLQVLTYYDKNLQQTNQTTKPTNYNPVLRPWYTQASKQTTQGAPYLFQFSQLPGITYSKKLPNNKGVIGLDVSLFNLSQNLAMHANAFSGEAYLIKQNGELIAQSNSPVLDERLKSITPLKLTTDEKNYVNQLASMRISNGEDWQPIDFSLSGAPKGYAVDALKMISEKTGIKLNFVNGFSWQQFTEQFKAKKLDILNGVYDTQENRDLGLLSDAYGNLPLGLLVKKNQNFSSLSQLHGKKLAIGSGWSIAKEIEQSHPQIEIVSFTKNHEMIELLASNKVDAALDIALIMDNLLKEFGVDNLTVLKDFSLDGVKIDTKLRMLLQKEHAPLLPIINRALAELQNIHIPQLEKKWLFNTQDKSTVRVLPYIQAIDQARKTTLESLHYFEYQGENKLLYFSELGSSLSQDQLLVLAIDESTLFAPVYKSVIESSLITMAVIAILLPLTYLFASPVTTTFNTLLLQTQQISNRDYSVVKVAPSNIIEVKRLSLAIKKMSNNLYNHELAQKGLIDAMVKLIAQAIDDKSPYTGGHCNRVPELSEMLLKVACKENTGIFESFDITSEQQWRELTTAAWLHDCGKITTPEHIVDKGSKLECIYNRIHEVRMRFEVLHRDIEITYLNALQISPEDKTELLEKCRKEQQQLQNDFAFIAHSNIGSEGLSSEAEQKIKQLAQQTWLRYFDDQLGLSPQEERELVNESAPLPAVEYLLADKEGHIKQHAKEHKLPDSLGIKMAIPENLANLGEIYNLTVMKGTLTTEDRFIINEHIISTIKILDQIPFPPELENVPRIASTHHETMRGDGYPRRLKGDELSIPERILALADIFEALTASDRPYKKAKPLSVSLNILHKMAIEEHIDLAVFQLFIKSKVYLHYANKFLPKEQIDTVDEQLYLG
ncbi:transporter substrate-binding domain-containing protein [Psychrosphaera sp. 1_MG-2023]|uniref:HD domain-containing phosphohydrolase n=1 Tax=Psychrosphaera sp. 1_MG-2023 TaxID=3062643 RepID=UPI0026E3A903|nr:HD domain-containing phosphohydrolase [Psychrosphaera sp. 1_MG-2023]MDO6719715.1 transporter substrate-binding domain-containing protein [Psychrosphaera sp. 1_MG-2023]